MSVLAQQQIDHVAMSAEKAALLLTRADLKKGIHREYGGWIIQNNEDGSHSYTKPVKGQEALIDLSKIPVPDGFTIVGDYHSGTILPARRWLDRAGMTTIIMVGMGMMDMEEISTEEADS